MATSRSVGICAPCTTKYNIAERQTHIGCENKRGGAGVTLRQAADFKIQLLTPIGKFTSRGCLWSGVSTNYNERLLLDIKKPSKGRAKASHYKRRENVTMFNRYQYLNTFFFLFLFRFLRPEQNHRFYYWLKRLKTIPNHAFTNRIDHVQSRNSSKSYTGTNGVEWHSLRKDYFRGLPSSPPYLVGYLPAPLYRHGPIKQSTKQDQTRRTSRQKKKNERRTRSG